ESNSQNYQLCTESTWAGLRFQWNFPITFWSAVALRLRLGFQQHWLRVAVFGHAEDQLGAVFEAFVESLQVELLHRRGDGIGDGLAQAVGVQHMGHSGEEADHHDVQHHLAAELLGEAGGGDAVEADALRRMIDAHQVLLYNQDAAGLQLRLEDLVGFLAHHHQDVRLGDVGIEDGLAGKDHLRGRRTAAGFRAEALRHGGVGTFEDGGSLADDDGGEDDALAAEAGDADFRESEFG